MDVVKPRAQMGKMSPPTLRNVGGPLKTETHQRKHSQMGIMSPSNVGPLKTKNREKITFTNG